jgi:hypothetical protein
MMPGARRGLSQGNRFEAARLIHSIGKNFDRRKRFYHLWWQCGWNFIAWLIMLKRIAQSAPND